MEAILPGSTVNAIGATLDLDFGTDYTVIALGTVSSATAPIRPLIIDNPTDERLTPGNFFRTGCPCGRRGARRECLSDAFRRHVVRLSADLLIAAVDDTGSGDTAVKLVVLDGTGAATLLADGTPAAVVAVHASPDAGSVDILADIEATANDEALPLAQVINYAALADCTI